MAPTCTTPGYTGDSNCIVCKCPLVGDDIPTLPHNTIITIIEPGCLVEGYTLERCQDCDHEERYNIIEALGHNYSSDITYPDCENGGCTIYTCERCGDNYIDDYTEALGHDYSSDITYPDCENGGYTTHICSRCNNSYIDEETEALGHNFENSVCKNCGMENEEVQIVESDHPYNSYTYDDWTIKYPNAMSITLTFSEETYFNEYGDYIKIYDADYNLVGTYTGSMASSLELTVMGQSVRIEMYIEMYYESGDGEYGFRAEAKPNYLKCSCGENLIDFTVLSYATCCENGEGVAVCPNCGVENTVELPISNHSWDHEGYCGECDDCCYHSGGENLGSCVICDTKYCNMCSLYGHDSGGCPNNMMWCEICGMFDHTSDYCPMNGMGCGMCGEFDHTSEFCPLGGDMMPDM